ncbi:MAG: 30S ribosomal protein S16 [Bacteroidia bacterium]|nr:30S ribosomal protein S16 [Bacteroidia bacterium]
MPVKIRLTRHGKKHRAYYHIVVADSRAPRDGKYIEVIGNYDPNTIPATIEINQDKALSWLKNGAQPTDTCRAILSYKGVLYNYHLQKGVAKGALTQEQADAKLLEWTEAKTSKVEEKRKRAIGDVSKVMESRLAEEGTKKEARLDALRKKNTPPPTPAPVAEVAVETSEAPAEESTDGEAPAEA